MMHTFHRYTDTDFWHTHTHIDTKTALEANLSSIRELSIYTTLR